MKKYLFFLLSCLFISACATKMTSERVSQIQGRSIVVTYDDFGSLSANKGKKILIPGVLNSVVTGIDGNDIAIQNQIPNPVIGTSKKLTALLAKKYKLTVKAPTPYPGMAAYEYAAAAEKAGGADLVLNVVTKYWASAPFNTNADHYNITIVTWAILKDVKTGNDIVSGLCNYNPKYENTDDAPTWDNLYANGAAGMKSEVTKSEDFCAQNLMDTVFDL